MNCPTCGEPWNEENTGRCENCGGTELVGQYSSRALKWAHCGKDGWMSEFATHIEIEDEGEGEFLFISQPFASTKLSNGGIAISPEEWPTLKALIDAAFLVIKQHEIPT